MTDRNIAVIFFLLLFSATSVPWTTAHGQKAGGQPSSWMAEAIKSGASESILKQYSPRLAQLQDAIAKHAVGPNSRFRTSDDIEKSIETLEEVRPKLREFVSQLAPKLREAQAKLEKLGPAPKQGATESEELASQRKAIGDEVAAYDGLIKRAEVLFIQAGQFVSAHSSQLRRKFLSDLLRRSIAITDHDFFANLKNVIAIRYGIAVALANQRLTRLFEAWPSALSTIFLSLIALLALRVLSHWLFRIDGLRHADEPSQPSRAERGALVLRRALAVLLPGVGGLLAALFVGHSMGLIREEEIASVSRFIAYSGVALFLISAIRFSLKPTLESERLIAIDTRSATAFEWLGAIYVAVWFADQVFGLLDQFFQTPFLLVVFRISIVSLLYAALMFGFIAVRIRRKGAHPSTRRTNGWPNWLFGLVALAAVIILASSLLGYASLARFIGSQLVATGGLVLLITLIHLTAEFISSPHSRPIEGGDEGKPTMLGASLGLAAGLGLDALIMLIGLPLLLLQWGFDWSEVRSWISSAVFGFQVGQLRISLLQIFVAVGVFLAGLLVTRLIRNMFVRRTEQMFVSSTGARDSIAAVLGYAGTILSFVAALTYVGIDLANLALIAGALSVGIGFGLQSIVNNFVSGLILLAERPIKVGDWIVVGDKQGRVQKISVRSTQIRMFDRATLVMPNADLITNQVINWDLGDSVGRVSINVGVSYDSDPRQVIKLLLDIGKSHPGVLVYDRSPRVMFEAFGDSSLNFVLHVHLRNIKDFLDVQTDLRVAIVEAFRGAGIEIPYPQRDLHLRSSDVDLGKNSNSH